MPKLVICLNSNNSILNSDKIELITKNLSNKLYEEREKDNPVAPPHIRLDLMEKEIEKVFEELDNIILVFKENPVKGLLLLLNFNFLIKDNDKLKTKPVNCEKSSLEYYMLTSYKKWYIDHKLGLENKKLEIEKHFGIQKGA